MSAAVSISTAIPRPDGMAKATGAALYVADLARGLRDLHVPFGIVGALVPELLLDTRPDRMTNDADVMVVVQTLGFGSQSDPAT